MEEENIVVIENGNRPEHTATEIKETGKLSWIFLEENE